MHILTIQSYQRQHKNLIGWLPNSLENRDYTIKCTQLQKKQRQVWKEPVLTQLYHRIIILS